MFSPDVMHFLQIYGYFIMVPLMIIEGPVATLAAALLAAVGVFVWPVVLILSIVSDLIADIGFYYLGKNFGMRFIKGPGKYLGMNERLVKSIEKHFVKHGGKTIFAAKSTTGLAQITFTTAGIVRMDFKKFLFYSFLGGILWSSFLVFIGYFYGYLWREIGAYIKEAGILVFLLAVATIVAIRLYKYFESRKAFGN
jgi:membrane protein DedA with SNARE-associated domain